MVSTALCRLACVGMLVLAGCQSGLELGFGVAVHLHFDASVSDAELATVQSFTVDASGGETFSTIADLTGKPLRDEFVIYRPMTPTRSLVLTFIANNTSGIGIAEGATTTLTLSAGKTQEVEVTLSTFTPHPDASVDVGVDAGDAGELPDGKMQGTDGAVPHVLAMRGVPTYATSGTPGPIALGDFDGDGVNDVVVLSGGTSLDVRLGSSAGAFGPLVTTPLSSAVSLMSVGDYNGDGHLDVAVAVAGGMSAQVMAGDGKGSFGTGFAASTGSQSITALATGNFDADKYADLVAISSGGTLIAYGGPTAFTPLSYGGNTQVAVVVGDVTGDGKPDIVTLETTAGSNGGSLAVLVNAQSGSTRGFTGAALVGLEYAAQARDLAIGDIDGDGVADIGVRYDYVFDTYLGQANTTPVLKEVELAGDPGLLPGSVLALVDWDGNKHADQLEAHSGADGSDGFYLALYAAAGPVFGPQSEYPTALQPGAMAVGALGTDTLPSAVIANVGSQSFSVIYNAVTTASRNPVDVLAPGSNIALARAAVGLLDADKKLDFVSGAQHGHAVSVMLGDGDDTFTNKVNAVPMGDEPDVMAIADIDGDQNADLVFQGQNTLDVAFGTGTGIFGTPTSQNLDAGLGTNGSIAIGDVNDDGKLDAIVVSTSSDTIFVNLGNGSKTSPFTLQSIKLPTGTSPTAVAIGDVNGDMLDDVIVTTPTSNGVYVALQSTAHTLGTPTLVTLQTGAQKLALANFDSDAKLDVAIAGPGGLFVARGDGTGNFTVALPDKLLSGDQVDEVIAVDLNNDGKVDIAALRSAQSTLLVYENLGSSFAAAQAYTVGSLPSGLTAGDFDGDGWTDLLVTSQVEGFVTLVKNLSH